MRDLLFLLQKEKHYFRTSKMILSVGSRLGVVSSGFFSEVFLERIKLMSFLCFCSWFLVKNSQNQTRNGNQKHLHLVVSSNGVHSFARSKTARTPLVRMFVRVVWICCVEKCLTARDVRIRIRNTMMNLCYWDARLSCHVSWRHM